MINIKNTYSISWQFRVIFKIERIKNSCLVELEKRENMYFKLNNFCIFFLYRFNKNAISLFICYRYFHIIGFFPFK